jgi:hypothetical protein
MVQSNSSERKLRRRLYPWCFDRWRSSCAEKPGLDRPSSRDRDTVMASDRSMILSSSPRSSHTPRHCGQKSISTPCRSEIDSVTLQMGQSMPWPVAVDEFMTISFTLNHIRTLQNFGFNQRLWLEKLDFVLRHQDLARPVLATIERCYRRQCRCPFQVALCQRISDRVPRPWCLATENLGPNWSIGRFRSP